MKKKLFISAATFFAVLALTGCDQGLFERQPPLPTPPYGSGTGYQQFDGLPVTIPPFIKSAEVLPADPSVIRVTFSTDVHIGDASMFNVKVNDKPAVRIGFFTGGSVPILDKASETRTVTAASSGKIYDTVWDLTISAPAKHGEIIRLSADNQSAYVNSSEGHGIPAPVATPAGQWPLSQFIVRNMVPRAGTTPAVAGFYRDGAVITSQLPAGAAGDLYQRAITWLTVPSNRTDGAAYTIVLGADQNYASANTFTAAQVPGPTTAANNEVSAATETFTIVLAADGVQRVITVTGTGPGNGPRGAHGDDTTNFANQDASALVLRNGVTLIIENNVVIQHENQGLASGVLSKYPLIAVRDGGKLILDGGEIRGNYVTAGTRGATNQRMNAGGVFVAPADDSVNNESTLGGQGFFIMNSGKVTGNTIQQNERGVSAGGIVLHRKAYFIMHGGEVSGNQFIFNSTATGIYQFYAGGIAGFGAPADNDSSNGGTNLSGIYMTGGEIKNNNISSMDSTQNVRITTGGVVLVGTLQKTGGTISGNTNNMPSTISTVGQYGQAVVNHTAAANKTEAHIFYRNADAGPDVLLFHEGIRTVLGDASSATSGGRVFGAGFKPPFVPASQNGWEN